MLIDYFPEVTPIIENSLSNAEQANIDDLLHYIHKLHGSCAYSGVPRLKSVCATIEQALRSGSSVEDIEPELFELQDEIDKVSERSAEFLV